MVAKRIFRQLTHAQQTMQENFEFVESHVECDFFNSVRVWISDAESQLNERLAHVLHEQFC